MEKKGCYSNVRIIRPRLEEPPEEVCIGFELLANLIVHLIEEEQSTIDATELVMKGGET